MSSKLYKNHTFRSEIGDYVTSCEKDVQERMRQCISVTLLQLKMDGNTTTLDIKTALRFLAPNSDWSQTFVSDCLHVIATHSDCIDFRDVQNSEGVFHRVYETKLHQFETMNFEAERDAIFKQLNL